MNNYIFMTITGKTCAGKSYLLDELISKNIVNKIVSCTTRPPRIDEINGRDYYFLSEEEFQWGLDRGDFIESVKFNDVYYGTTYKELETKIDNKKPGAIIIEPNGIKNYEKYCSTQNIKMLKTFVITNENVRLERLNNRFLKELEFGNENKIEIIKRFTKRIYTTAIEEQKWLTAHNYDLYITGEYLNAAVSLIEKVILEILKET
ncbi:MAG: hypothetical protein QXG00_08725 [Candidatus Woesearchaeota archaeon]